MAQGLSRASNIVNNQMEVQRVWSITSDRFVLELPTKYVQTDPLIAIIIFKNVVRGEYFWRNQKQSTNLKFYEKKL